MYRNDLRPTIVTSFIEEFNLHGPKLTLDKVASRIHISKKTIYRFFRSKDDIYAYLLNEACTMIHREQSAIAADPNRSTRQKIIDILTIPSVYETRMDISKLPMLETESPAIFKNFLHAFEISWNDVSSLLLQGQEEGIVKKDINVPLAVGYLEGCLQHLFITPLLKTAKLTYTEAIHQLVDTFLFGAFVE
ncbi:MAG: TetR/AcrR family transcriptional regulator [Candidatus Enteromonas sp.]|nr:TetR/AcrR family transcriptional regulator [Candidatus Enteromonas sp.]